MNLKSILQGFFVVLLTFCLVGCSSNEVEQKPDEDVVQGNCKVEDCIKQVEVSNTVEDINKVIGIDAEKSEYSEEYKWKLNEKESIVLKVYDSGNIIQATIDKKSIMNEDVDFSNFNDLKKKLESGTSFTYEELVANFNGVEGVIAGKTSTSNRYIWVDSMERVFSATINLTTKKCSIISLK